MTTLRTTGHHPLASGRVVAWRRHTPAAGASGCDSSALPSVDALLGPRTRLSASQGCSPWTGWWHGCWGHQPDPTGLGDGLAHLGPGREPRHTPKQKAEGATGLRCAPWARAVPAPGHLGPVIPGWGRPGHGGGGQPPRSPRPAVGTSPGQSPGRPSVLRPGSSAPRRPQAGRGQERAQFCHLPWWLWRPARAGRGPAAGWRMTAGHLGGGTWTGLSVYQLVSGWREVGTAAQHTPPSAKGTKPSARAARWGGGLFGARPGRRSRPSGLRSAAQCGQGPRTFPKHVSKSQAPGTPGWAGLGGAGGALGPVGAAGQASPAVRASPVPRQAQCARGRATR